MPWFQYHPSFWTREERRVEKPTNSVLMSGSQLRMPGAQSYRGILRNPEECALELPGLLVKYSDAPVPPQTKGNNFQWARPRHLCILLIFIDIVLHFKCHFLIMNDWTLDSISKFLLITNNAAKNIYVGLRTWSSYWMSTWTWLLIYSWTHWSS